MRLVSAACEHRTRDMTSHDVHPSCIPSGSSGALTIESWDSCRGTPLFQDLTNNTGCCLATGKPGVCDLCSHVFTCAPPNKSPFAWGIVVALIGDILISFGLALQKVAHNKVEQRKGKTLLSEDGQTSDGRPVKKEPTHTSDPVWWLGVAIQIVSEVGNFAAYGDPSTPAAVVASLGCISVIANWAISAFWLKEGLRLRDVFGVALVVLGVVLIIVFVPKDPVGGTLNLLPCPIVFVLGNVSEHTCEYPASWPNGDTFSSPHETGVAVCKSRGLLAVGSIYFYFIQPIWLVFMCLSLALLAWLLVYTRRYKPKNFLPYIGIADIMGGYTVCSAVCVSSFFFERILAKQNIYVGAEPALWVAIIVLAATCVLQLQFINSALALNDAGVVIPTHYVLFTIVSIICPSVLYQQLTLDPELLPMSPMLMLFMFLFGVAACFGGVWLIVAGKKPQEAAKPGGTAELGGALAGVELESVVDSEADSSANGSPNGSPKRKPLPQEQTEQTPPPPIPAEPEGSRSRRASREMNGGGGTMKEAV